MKLKLTIAYFGQRYHGWQRQRDDDTVQERVEAAARRVFGQPVNVVGASRTDAGVHAEGQTAHVELAERPRVPADRIAAALTSRLPKDIDIREAVEVDESFDARKGACWKWYRYRIHNVARRPTADWGRVWHYWREMDDDLLADAAGRLVGRRDFAALASVSRQPRETSVRSLFRVDVSRHYDQVIVDVLGDGFLYKMVRNIVGLLTEVGRGQVPPQRVDELLAMGTAARQAGGMPAAPAQGLTLMEIHYTPHPLAGKFKDQGSGVRDQA